MNSVEGYKGFITFLILSGILFTVLFGFNYISKTQSLTTKASPSATTPLNIEIQNVTASTAEVKWTTQESANGVVALSMSETLCINNNDCIEIKEATPTKSHLLRLVNLNSNTQYFFQVKDSNNNYYPESGPITFTTTQAFSETDTRIITPDSFGIEPNEPVSPSFEPLIDNHSVLGRNTNVVDQLITDEFKEAMIFNNENYDFNKDGQVTVSDYPLFIQFITNRED